MAITFSGNDLNIPVFTVTGAGNNQNIGSKTVTLGTKDTYVTDDLAVTVGASINVKAATLGNAASSGVTYTANTADSTIIPSGGSLYINAGWIGNTQITLGHMIPDDTTYANAGVDHIRSGYEAFSVSGTKLVGTMADTTLTSSGGTLSGSISFGSSPTTAITVTPTINSDCTLITEASTYGIVTTGTAPSGTNGTDYLTIDPDATGGTATNTASITVSRAKVETSGIAGYYDGSVCTLAADELANSKNISVSTTIAAGTNYYIPIVTPAGTGGDVSKASSGSSAVATVPNPTVTLSHTGEFTSTESDGTGTMYGVVEGTPSTGTDGVDYLKITTGGASNSTNVSGTATIKYTRAAVKAAATYKGLVSMTTSTSLLAAKSPSTGLKQDITGTATASVAGGKTYYIPIVNDETFSGGDVTATVSNGTVTQSVFTRSMATPKYGTSNASSTNLTKYGISTTTTSGGANNYFTFAPSGSYTTNGGVTIYADASTTAVTHSHSAGAVQAHTNVQAIAGKTATQKSSTLNFAPTTALATSGAACYRIAIVSPQGSGGSVTANATASITTTTVPIVDVNYSGSMTGSDATNWGVATTQPSDWTDGTSGICLLVSSSSSDGSVSGTISGTWSRAAVMGKQTYRGAVNITTSTTLLDASGSTAFTGDDFSSDPFQATITGGTAAYYITKATIGSVTGGGLVDKTMSVTAADASNGTSGTYNISITPTIAFNSRSGSTDGSAITQSEYGIQTTAPTSSSGDWVKIDPGATQGKKKSVSASVTAERSAISVTVSKGITTGGTASSAKATKSYSGSTTVGTSVDAGTNYYVPVVTIPKPTFSNHSVTTAPSVAMSETVTRAGSSTTVPTGIKTQASVPSGWTDYITITPSGKKTDGTVSATSTVTVAKGITKGGTSTSDASTCTVTPGTSVSNKTFIKIYDGTYTIS